MVVFPLLSTCDARVVTWSRLLLAPDRSWMVTVPSVVGVHVIVVGLPALIIKPGSRVKGLGLLPCAVAKARMELAMHNSERRILRE